MVIENWPDKTDGHWLAARIYKKINRDDEAISELEIVKRLDPDDRISREYLAGEYVRAGRILEGVREFSKTIPQARRAIMVTALILTAIFLVVLIWVAFLVRGVLAPDRSRAARRRKDHDADLQDSGG